MENVTREQAQEKFDAVMDAMHESGRTVRKDAHGEDLIVGPSGHAVWLELVRNDDGDWLVGASFDTVIEAETSFREGDDEVPDRIFSEPTTPMEMVRVIEDYFRA
ncbi:hypothetical protein EPN44_13220 [bacterium]|nr:MAG: hypothetical protein EPN44_13220 [bacterium]